MRKRTGGTGIAEPLWFPDLEHLAKDHVLPVEVGCWDSRDEELGAVGPRACTAHQRQESAAKGRGQGMLLHVLGNADRKLEARGPLSIMYPPALAMESRKGRSWTSSKFSSSNLAP